MYKHNKKIVTKLTLMFFLTGFFLQLNSQTLISKTYYTSIYKVEQTKKKKKAQYVEIINEIGEGTTGHELFRLADDQLVKYECYKDGIPTGIWKAYNEDSGSFIELDYSTEVIYSKELIENGRYFSLGNKAINQNLDPETVFVAPTLKDESNPLELIYQSMEYPSEARKEGVEGVVIVHVKVDKTGQLEVLSVTRSRGPHLDAEAVRLLSKMQEWNPATLDGVAIDSYSTVKVYFRLL